MLKCKINGKEVEVKEGTLIIDAIKQANDDIATTVTIRACLWPVFAAYAW